MLIHMYIYYCFIYIRVLLNAGHFQQKHLPSLCLPYCDGLYRNAKQFASWIVKKKKKKEPKAFRFSSSFHRIPVLHLKSRSMKVQLAPRSARIPFTYRTPMDPVKQPSAISAGSHGVCTNTLPSLYSFFFHSPNTHMVFPVSLLHRGNMQRLLRYNPFFTPLSTLHL